MSRKVLVVFQAGKEVYRNESEDWKFTWIDRDSRGREALVNSEGDVISISSNDTYLIYEDE